MNEPAHISPVMAGDLLNRIRVERTRLPKPCWAITDGILSAPDEIAVRSISDAAKQLDVSASGLVRFAKAVDYSGFSLMQKVLLRGLVDGGASYREYARDIVSLNNERADIDRVFEAPVSANKQALKAAHANVGLDALSGMVPDMQGALIVGVLGQKRVFPLVNYLFHGLVRLDFEYLLIDGSGGMTDRQAGALGVKDVLLVITFAPNAPDTVALAEAATARGTRIVVITDSPDAPSCITQIEFYTSPRPT